MDRGEQVRSWVAISGRRCQIAPLVTRLIISISPPVQLARPGAAEDGMGCSVPVSGSRNEGEAHGVSWIWLTDSGQSKQESKQASTA